METLTPGTVYVVATPIGNLEDMTFRSLRILRSVDRIAAEDTRHTGKLLHYFQIDTPQWSYHEHNCQQRLPQILEHLRQGGTLALVTDAGMPGISDPGTELVRACCQEGLGVVPLPGACAVITALVGAGLPTERFVFEGFLPAKAKARQRALGELAQERRTLVFYESPHRLREMLRDLAVCFGDDRSVVLARELTKLHEEFWRGTVGEAIVHYQTRDPQGEYTVVVAGAAGLERPNFSEVELQMELQTLMAQVTLLLPFVSFE